MYWNVLECRKRARIEKGRAVTTEEEQPRGLQDREGKVRGKEPGRHCSATTIIPQSKHDTHHMPEGKERPRGQKGTENNRAANKTGNRRWETRSNGAATPLPSYHSRKSKRLKLRPSSTQCVGVRVRLRFVGGSTAPLLVLIIVIVFGHKESPVGWFLPGWGWLGLVLLFHVFYESHGGVVVGGAHAVGQGVGVYPCEP